MHRTLFNGSIHSVWHRRKRILLRTVAGRPVEVTDAKGGVKKLAYFPDDQLATDVKALMAANYGKYDIALDPLWNGEYEQEAEPFGKDEIAFYQCDHLGTPQELTDHEGKVAWSAQYKARGQAKEAISEAACKAGRRNPIRFQGQYLDHETGLHCNRYRYYDPHSGRFVSKDPIGLLAV